MAVGHHAWRDGAWRWRLDVLVDDLTVDALAVAFAIVYIDVVVLVDVARRSRAVDRACVGVDVPVRAVGRAVHALVDRAVAYVRVYVPVGIVGRAGRRILVDVSHRPRIDIIIGVRVGGRILVDVRICGRTGRCIVVSIGIVRRAVRGCVVDIRCRRGN